MQAHFFSPSEVETSPVLAQLVTEILSTIFFLYFATFSDQSGMCV